LTRDPGKLTVYAPEKTRGFKMKVLPGSPPTRGRPSVCLVLF